MKRATISKVLAAFAAIAALAAPASAQAGSLTGFGGSVTESAGAPLLLAGSHPDLTTKVTFASEPAGNSVVPVENVKDVNVRLPSGFVGYAGATPLCKLSELLNPVTGAVECSPETQVGIAEVTSLVGEEVLTSPYPVYNAETPVGVATRFAFKVNRVLIFVDSSATYAEGEYRVETKVDSISQALPLLGTELRLWGVPASPIHQSERYFPKSLETGAVSYAPQVPLLRAPTSCSNAPSVTRGEVDFWQTAGSYQYPTFEDALDGTPIVYGGCEALPFTGSISARPTTSSADSPSGLNVKLTIPQNQNPEGRATSDLRSAQVTLPEGMTINPSSAGGLGSCSASQIGLGTNVPASCPEDSKIGSVEIVTPLLGHPLDGSVYLAHQGENKFGALLAAYIAVNDPASGTVLKLAGRVATDPKTGRIVASFDENPQLPFESLSVDFFGGARAPLTTPPTCGTYTTSATLTPWSGTAPVSASDSFQITSGPDGSACPSGAFGPKLEASVTNPLAGSYSPLQLRVSRADGTARLGGLSITLPKGFLAKLAGIPYCSDAALAAVPTGEGTGAAQLATPSCPAASRVGSVSVGSGSGPTPFAVNTGAVYLAGPYKGAPISVAIVTPAVAGPFDLGNVVVRTALNVDPETAQVTAVSDPLPTILDGIPLDLRDVRVTLDRSGFTVQPTACGSLPFGGSATSVTGATAPLSSPYAVAGCSALPFKPKLSVAINGPTRRAAYPALVAKLTPRAGDANLGKAVVSLPHSEFLAQNHIGTICTRPQFAAQQCPKRSIYGYAEATTPLLAKPLKGPVYLRSNNGARQLPDLVAALRGQFEIDLVGFIDSKGGGIRTRFLGAPDAPVSSFTLRMKGGKQGLLQNSVNLCAKPLHARISLAAQNGKQASSSPLLGTRCH